VHLTNFGGRLKEIALKSAEIRTKTPTLLQNQKSCIANTQADPKYSTPDRPAGGFNFVQQPRYPADKDLTR
jgi:hypothetical protein